MPSSLQYKLQGLHLVLRPEPGLLDTMPLWEEANEDSFATMPVFLRVIPEYHRHTLGMPPADALEKVQQMTAHGSNLALSVSANKVFIRIWSPSLLT